MKRLKTPSSGLPEWYHSLISTEDKLNIARDAMRVATERGLTPVAASVTGSRLRGVDHEGSDTDVLVLVSEKLPRAKTWQFSEEVEGQVQSVYQYASLLTRSVPYLEFQKSPFMVADASYAPFLASLRLNPYLWGVHAEGFVGHLLSRSAVDPAKRLRTALCVWWLIESGTPLFPRHLLDDPPVEALMWLREVGWSGPILDANSK